MNSTYLQEKFLLPSEKINIIFECGSRDCLDAIELAEYYWPCFVYSFECNPESIPVCERNIEGIAAISLIKKAVYNENGKVKFYPTDMERSIDKNIGASSLLWHKDNKNEFFQKEIEVEAIRLDTFMKSVGLSYIDLLCMDLQGAEHLAIEGLGDFLQNVRFVITEAEKHSHYEGSLSFIEKRKFFQSKGYKQQAFWKGNILFERNGLDNR